MHGRRPGEVIHYDYFYVGVSGSLGKDGLDGGDEFKYTLIMMDDLSNFVMLEPTESCKSASTAKHLLRWCKTLGVPEVWVSDIASYFKTRVMKTLEGALRVKYRFAVVNSPWSSGPSKRMISEMKRVLKATLQEERRDIRERVDVVPAVQCALNTVYRMRSASTPYHVTFRREPLTDFSTLASLTGEDWKVDALDEETLRRKVASVMEAQQRLHKVVEERVKNIPDRQRQAASRGQLPNFAVGDFVMVARVRRPGLMPKLVSTWYAVQEIVTGEIKDVHVIRLRFYVDKDLEMTTALKELFKHAFTQGEFEMAGIVDISEDEEGHGFDVKVCMYVCMVITYSRVWIKRVRLPILLVVS